MRRARLPAALAAALAIAGTAWAGHEMSVYPSYYPHEIVIATMAPERAAAGLPSGGVHAWLGREPPFAGAMPDTVRAVESLGDFVVLRVNPAAAALQNDAATCAATAAIAREIAGRGGFTLHPYPVTPFHGDYLYHSDRAAAAQTRLVAAASGTTAPLRVTAADAIAAAIPPQWRSPDAAWDVAVETIDAAGLAATAATTLNGWLGPPWVRTGWFQAVQLLADATADDETRQRIAAMTARLEAGDYGDTLERLNLERGLVGALAGNCRRTVAGYTVKRQYFSAEFANGIENIGFDAIAGLNSPIFLRTVKLKDFPWNGWLSLGIDARPQTAWNPIAGFADGFGRLLWAAVGDPALISAPYDSGWLLNRATDVQSSAAR